jgi:hypothetical protein
MRLTIFIYLLRNNPFKDTVLENNCDVKLCRKGGGGYQPLVLKLNTGTVPYKYYV